MTVKHQQDGGIGFVGLLTIVFIVLKLTGFIDWSWWLVLSPALISFGLCVLILLVFLGIAIREDRKDRERRDKLWGGK